LLAYKLLLLIAKLGCFAVVVALLSLVPGGSSSPEDEATRSDPLVNGVAGLMTVAPIKVRVTIV